MSFQPDMTAFCGMCLRLPNGVDGMIYWLSRSGWPSSEPSAVVSNHTQYFYRVLKLLLDLYKLVKLFRSLRTVLIRALADLMHGRSLMLNAAGSARKRPS